MKKILAMIIAVLVISTVLGSCGKKAFNQAKKDASGNVAQEQIDDKTGEDSIKAVGFKSSHELAEKFMSVCSDGDVEAMYGLYYNEMLDKIYARIKDKLSKEEFDDRLKAEMLVLTNYEIYEYGGEELQDTVPPLYYVDYLQNRATGEDSGLTTEQVTDCATLRVYKDDGSYSDHMLAQIDGDWYVTL